MQQKFHYSAICRIRQDQLQGIMSSAFRDDLSLNTRMHPYLEKTYLSECPGKHYYKDFV